MMTQTEALVRRYYDATNNAEWGQLDSCLHADFDHNTAFVPRGREPFKRILSGYRNGFPDLKSEIVELIESGNRVTVRTKTCGTHSGNFLGHPPTDRHFSAFGIDVFEVEAERLTACYSVFDTIAMLQQLGLYQPQGQ